MTDTYPVDIDHILRSLFNATVNSVPFEHSNIHNFFSDADFANIYHHWPEFDAFSPLSAENTAWYSERGQFKLTDENLLSLKPNQRNFWEGLRQSLLTLEVAKATVKKFETSLSRKMASGTKSSVEVDIRLMEDRTSYSLSPHTDVEVKLVTLLIYLPTDLGLTKFGTSLYKPRDPNRIFDYSKHHARKDFELVKTIPFLPNSALLFPRGDNTFHGVEPFTAADKMRRTIAYNLYLMPDE